MLVGCSSQNFCEFKETAPIASLPVPQNVASAFGWGTVLMPVSFEEAGIPRDYLAAAGGPRSQTDVFQLAVDGALDIDRSPTLTDICDREASLEDESSTCYERHAGAGLAWRSSFFEGQSCVAVGMAGRERDPGIGFWCAQGTRHLAEDRAFRAVPYEVRTLSHVLAPVERIFIGTEHSIHLLDGDTDEIVQIVWRDDSELPLTGYAADAISTLEAAEVSGGYLLAVGYPELKQVLIGHVETPLEGEEQTEMILYGCIEIEEEGFGSSLKLARLGTTSPTDLGPPVLLAGSRWGYEGRVPAVHIFDLDLSVASEDVVCGPATPSLSLECDEVSGVEQGADTTVDVDCSMVGSGFGTAFDVGNLDDTPEQEVIVGCPGATADGYGRAGAAYIFRPTRNGGDVLSVLIDSSEERQEIQLGAGVTIAPVGDRFEPIVAGPGEGSLLMFLCSGIGDSAPEWDSPMSNSNSLEDPRCRSLQH